MRDSYKSIYLDSTSHPVTVSPQAYEQIVAIVQANCICTHCLKGYTQENPQVAENVCLACFQQYRVRNNQTSLTFVCEVPSAYAARYGYQVFRFVDQQGYVYLTNSQNKLNHTLEQDMHQTLLHYGFQLPEQYTLKSGQEVELSSISWLSIYGDFRNSPVILATYHENYGNHIDTAFVLYRDSEPLELSKQKNPTRQWYKEAKAALEATYTPRQGYVVSTGVDGQDRTSSHLYDSHTYPGIVARAVAAYEQRKKEPLL